MNTFLDPALRLAEQNLRVFPVHGIVAGKCTCSNPSCSSPGKHPMVTDWQTVATTVTEVISEWAAKWPSANIGLTTGAGNGIVVLDVDPAHGGTESLEELRAELGGLPDTVTVDTGGGGTHFYFAHPGEVVRNRTGFRPGLDLRGDQGYVVAPGSRHRSGGVYVFSSGKAVGEIAFAAMPELLAGSSPPGGFSNVVGVPYEIPELVGAGMRHNTLVSLAGTLRNRGCTASEINVILGFVNQARCRPVLDDAEVASIAAGSSTWSREGAAGVDAIQFVPVSTIDPRPVHWLWRGFIPKGKLIVLDGDPGLGKSTMTLDLAARISRGGPMPNDQMIDGPGDVLVLTAEDGIADTVRPRLDAAGAELTRVHVMSLESALPRVPDHLGQIEECVSQHHIQLVIIDPITAFLGVAIDSYKDQSIRGALSPLTRMAERTGAAVLMVRHLTKDSDKRALYRGGGSMGIIGAARVGLVVARHPEVPEQVVLAVTKANISKEPLSLAFELEDDDVHRVGKVVWRGEANLDADDLFGPDATHSKLDGAADWLSDLLSSEAGGMPSDEVERLAKDNGFSTMTLRRAKEKVGAVASKRDGGKWWCCLPESVW